MTAGWTLSNIVCTGATNSTITIGAAGLFNPGDTKASVVLAAGENVTCTFTNRQNASVRIEKVSIGGIGTFTFTDNIPGGPTSLTTQTAGVAMGQTVSNVAPGTYTVTEVGPPAGWNFTSLNCSGGGGNTSTSGQTATIGVDPGETINCTYTNTKVQEVCSNDTKAPTVSVYATLKNPTRVQLKVIDTGSGVKTIEVIVAQNMTVVVPPFVPGTTNQIIVEATKINESSSSQVGLRVTDMCGNVTVFDPVTVTVNAGGKREGIQFNDVPGDETLVQIQNLGLQHLRITVNGRHGERAEPGRHGNPHHRYWLVDERGIQQQRHPAGTARTKRIDSGRHRLSAAGPGRRDAFGADAARKEGDRRGVPGLSFQSSVVGRQWARRALTADD